MVWGEGGCAKNGMTFPEFLSEVASHGVVVTDVAAMGMSCGGLMSYGASNDPRVATIGIWNSGLLEADQELYDAINGSVIIVTGGESDMAYANGKRDFEARGYFVGDDCVLCQDSNWVVDSRSLR
jgi:dienelactone hydrolase